MYMSPKGPLAAQPIPAAMAEPEMTRNEMLEAVAQGLEARGAEQLLGIEGVEERDYDEMVSLSPRYTDDEARAIASSSEHMFKTRIDGTIFGAIAEEMAAIGYDEPTTIGEVAKVLGIDLEDEVKARDRLNRLGCWCLGQVVEAQEVAERIRAFMR